VRSASERLPSLSTLFASAVTSGEPYTGSVTSCRLAAGPLRGISALLLLRAVPTARLLAVADTLGVERTADDLVTHTGQVADTAAADQHDGVLLEVVADAGNVGGDLNLACQPDAGDLAQRGVRLLGRGRVYARAHATTLRALLERRRLVLRHLVLAALADQLLDRGQPSLRLPVVFLLSSSRVLALGSPVSRAIRKPGKRRFPVVSTRLTCTYPLSSDPRGRVCRARPSADGKHRLTGRQPTLIRIRTARERVHTASCTATGLGRSTTQR